MKRTLLLLTFLLVTDAAWSDMNITGVVKDNQNQPLAGVHVFVSNQLFRAVHIDFTAVTNAQGEFSIVIPEGNVEQRMAYNYDVLTSNFSFSHRNIQLEFGAPDVLPHRWNSEGARTLDCAFGCRNTPDSGVDDINLGPLTTDLDLGEVVLTTGGGKQYFGTAADEQGLVMPDLYAVLASLPGGELETEYFPVIMQSDGAFASLAVPIQSDMNIAAFAPGYTKVFHDGTQCERSGFCRPAKPTTSTSGIHLTLKKSGTIEVNPPSLPSGSEHLFRSIRIFDDFGQFLGYGSCAFYSLDANSPEQEPCRFEGLLKHKTYHLVFVGHNSEGGVTTPMQRLYHDGTVTGCGMQFSHNNLPDTGLVIGGNGLLSMDFPDMVPGLRLGGVFIDRNTQKPIEITEPGSPNLYLELIDSKTLESAGILFINAEEGYNASFSSCSTAGIPAGSYHLALSSHITHTSLMDAGPQLGDYKRFVYGGNDCVGRDCDFSGAAVVELTNTDVTGLEIEIEKGSRIHGCYHYADHSPVVYVFEGESLRHKMSVQIFTDSGDYLETAQLRFEDLGNDQYQLCYSSSAYPAGNYLIRTNNGTSLYTDIKNKGLASLEAFDHTIGFYDSESGMGANPCSGAGCVMNDVISLDGNNHVQRHFYLTEGPVISAQLKNNINGSLLANGLVYAELYDSVGNWLGRYQFVAETGRFSTPALADGDYEIKITGGAPYFELTEAEPEYQAPGLHQSVYVTINGASEDVGVITMVNDIIFNDGFDNNL